MNFHFIKVMKNHSSFLLKETLNLRSERYIFLKFQVIFTGLPEYSFFFFSPQGF